MMKKLFFLSVVLFLCGVARGEDRTLFFNYDTEWRVHLFKTDQNTLRGYASKKEIEDNYVTKTPDLKTPFTSAKQGNKKFFFKYLSKLDPTHPLAFTPLKDLLKVQNVTEKETWDVLTDEPTINAIVQGAINSNFISAGTPLPYPDAGGAKSGTGAGEGEEKPLPKGLVIPAVTTTTSECEDGYIKRKVTTPEAFKHIKHLWRHAGAATANPANDDYFIYFFKEKSKDTSGRNGAYATFANTCTDAGEDPKTAGFNVKRFSIKVDNKIYPTSEHYFQIHKFNNPDLAYNGLNEIDAHDLPGEVSNKIKANTNVFDGQRADWLTGGGVNVMLKAVRAKFFQDEGLKKLLLSTYPKILVEDTAQRDQKGGGDPIWGANPTYTGCNQLGQILIHVRQELHDGQLYEFKKGDAQNYYERLSKTGPAKWDLDTSGDKKYVPAGYDNELAKTTKTGGGAGGKKIDNEPVVDDSDLRRLAEVLREMTA